MQTKYTPCNISRHLRKSVLTCCETLMCWCSGTDILHYSLAPIERLWCPKCQHILWWQPNYFTLLSYLDTCTDKSLSFCCFQRKVFTKRLQPVVSEELDNVITTHEGLTVIGIPGYLYHQEMERIFEQVRNVSIDNINYSETTL